MSNTGTPETPAKPAKPARKAAPRRRKPANKAAPAESIEQTTQAANPMPPGSDADTMPAVTPELDARSASATAVAAATAPTTHAALAAAAQPIMLIRAPMVVRWRDLDAFNHVNNATYLSYLEEARLQWMLTLPGLGLDDHVAPVVAAAHLNYRRPIEWPAEVMIELFVERLGNTSLSIGHRILAKDDARVLFCDGNVVMVWIDRDTGAAAPLPAAVRDTCR